MNVRSALKVAVLSFLLPVPAVLAAPQAATGPSEQLVAAGQITVDGVGGTSLADVLALEPGMASARDAKPAASMTQLAQATRAAAATPTSVSANGIPAAALRAYRAAETTMNIADPACELSWGLLAGIGRVESDHGRFGGAVVGEDGLSTPRIIGVPLNGAGPVAAIADTDEGSLDGDRRWDRAVGPMQFIPSTWSMVGIDGDGNGERDPHDLDDAALAAAAYLCVGDLDLGTTYGMQHAVFGYNHSDDYVALVLGVANTYESGLVDLPAIAASPLLGATGPGVSVGLGQPGQGVRIGASDDQSKKAKDKPAKAKNAKQAKDKQAKKAKRADKGDRGKAKRAGGKHTTRPERRNDDKPSSGNKPKGRETRTPGGKSTGPGRNGPKGGGTTPPAKDRRPTKPPKPRPAPEAPQSRPKEYTGTVVGCGKEFCLDEQRGVQYTLDGTEAYDRLVGQLITVVAVLDGETLVVDHIVQTATALAEPAL